MTNMADKQVLFRIDGKLLENLDKKLSKEGYATRNAWFKEVVSSYAGRSRASSKGAKRKSR